MTDDDGDNDTVSAILLWRGATAALESQREQVGWRALFWCRFDTFFSKFRESETDPHSRSALSLLNEPCPDSNSNLLHTNLPASGSAGPSLQFLIFFNFGMFDLIKPNTRKWKSRVTCKTQRPRQSLSLEKGPRRCCNAWSWQRRGRACRLKVLVSSSFPQGLSSPPFFWQHTAQQAPF